MSNEKVNLLALSLKSLGLLGISSSAFFTLAPGDFAYRENLIEISNCLIAVGYSTLLAENVVRDIWGRKQ